MRISKEPELRKKEILDTAMKIFALKGYEKTTMADIARAINVVPGLCYRYFRSKHELFQESISVYAKECIAPMILIMEKEEDSIDKYFLELKELYIERDGKEKYHDFFHGEGNDMFNKQLSITICDILIPHVTKFIISLNKKGMINIENPTYTAKFILYGQIPIVNDESLTSIEKVDMIKACLNKFIHFE